MVTLAWISATTHDFGLVTLRDFWWCQEFQAGVATDVTDLTCRWRVSQLMRMEAEIM